MTTDPSPLHTYTLTTAEPPEGAVVGDKSKDWTISLLEERLESRIIMTNSLEAKVRNLQANLDAAHRELASLRTQLATWENAGRDLGAVIATRDETILVRDAMIADLEETNERQNEALHQSRESADESSRHARILEENLEGRDSFACMLQKDVHTLVEAADDLAGQLSEAKATITSLRTQLTRAAAIEAKAKAAWREFRDGGNEGLVMTAMRQLRDSFSASPAPEPAEPKCSHCGTGISPENLTCGGCGRWLGKPAAKPTAARLAILERVAKEAKAFMDAKGDGVTVAYQAFRLAISDLEKLEATPCRSR